MHGNAAGGEGRAGPPSLVCVVIFAVFAPITMRIYKNKQ